MRAQLTNIPPQGGYVVISRLFIVEELPTAASAPLDDLFKLQDRKYPHIILLSTVRLFKL